MGKLASFVIVTPAGAGLEGSRRAEEHDGVADLFFPEVRERIEVFAQHPQRPRIGCIEKLLVAVGGQRVCWSIWINHVEMFLQLSHPPQHFRQFSGMQ